MKIIHKANNQRAILITGEIYKLADKLESSNPHLTVNSLGLLFKKDKPTVSLCSLIRTTGDIVSHVSINKEEEEKILTLLELTNDIEIAYASVISFIKD